MVPTVDADRASDPGDARAIIVYDGHCAFCKRQVERIRKQDRYGRFEYVAWQSTQMNERFARLVEGELGSGIRLILPDGRILIGADAVHGIAQRLDGWRRLAWLYRVPLAHSLCRALYRWIAANRYRIAGRFDARVCDKLTQEHRDPPEALS